LDDSSFNWRRLYYFLPSGPKKKKKNSIGDRKWNDLYKCQFKPGSLTDIPFLVRTSALLKKYMPIISSYLVGWLKLIGLTTIIAHLYIPKDILFMLAHWNTKLSIFCRFFRLGAMRTMSSANNSPQQRSCQIFTPYFLHLLRISFINKLNKMGERGQSCFTPRLIGNLSDNISKTLPRALVVGYRLNGKSKH